MNPEEFERELTQQTKTFVEIHKHLDILLSGKQKLENQITKLQLDLLECESLIIKADTYIKMVHNHSVKMMHLTKDVKELTESKKRIEELLKENHIE